MTESCPSCGAAASGRFCNGCGAALNAACRECGNPLPRGARFCNECGVPAVAPPAAELGRAPVLPWAVAAVAVVALAGTLLAWRGGDDQPAPTPAVAPVAAAPSSAPGPLPAAAGASGGASSVDLANMTPREAADRLFNRVMQNVTSGDSAAARQFIPMAIGAYGRVDPLDTDGRYHLAVLHLVGGQYNEARAQADSILATDPKHLFGLFTAAQAEQGRGNRPAAAALFRRFLAAFDSESTRKDVVEYQDHQPALPGMKEAAEAGIRD
ncbi:MAG TPA: zinc ribbon domain-containing protein [Longimicrobium sp.]|nr:zinc ribbon domain-containing protein [Longimicrobium sp.]